MLDVTSNKWHGIHGIAAMPSGKKARGRQNRAKKKATRNAAYAADLRTLWEPTLLRSNDGVASPNCDSSSSCEHRLAVLPRIPREGPAVSVMNSLAENGFFDKGPKNTRFAGDPVKFCIQLAVRCFPGGREGESERSLATNLLLRFIRNVFVHSSMIEGENWFHQRSMNEIVVCSMIGILELLGTYSDMYVVERRVYKISNKFAFGNRRDLLKFVAKRLPCTRLKKLHSAAREKVPKVDICNSCENYFPRSQLYVCTGCRCSHYCSRECQKAVWTRHKKACTCYDPEVMRRDLPAEYVPTRGSDCVPKRG